ncbi:CASP-like protein 4A3 [Capsicum annuum]|uniref:CASP-like protein 4A3 n=1 Tax=Capsicum annuum TaxID=4072 RepID=UPI0007BFAD18|nr:CASP-like protein 4A3 [Capsicum annuum]
MKNQNPQPNSNSNSSHRNLQKQNSHISMSDTESQVSQLDSFHSPLRSESPLRSDEPFNEPRNPKSSPSKAIVALDKYFSPNLTLPPATPPPPATERRSSPVVYFSRAVREDSATGVAAKGGVRGDVERGGQVGGERRSRAAVESILERSKRDAVANRVALGFRVCEIVFCLVAFSVMAADKTQGWTGDSFDRYKEYRYLVAVNVIGFVYSGFQAFDLAYSLSTGKHFLSHHMQYHFDFSMDQILAYLLMSASSSAATRVDDWASNWGKDSFTEMASASIAMSFLAFAAFALSSIISGYNLCNRSSS